MLRSFPKQIPLALPVDPAMGEEDFLITSSNSAATRALEEYRAPASAPLLLLGPKGSGKSHLSRIWQKKCNAHALELAGFDPARQADACALLWEDADKTEWHAASQKNAFHLLNLVRENGLLLLITASTPPLQWALNLADLRSRLLAVPVAAIEPPDDTLLAGLLLKHLNDRQLRVAEEVLNYLLARAPRDGAALGSLIETLDRIALAQGRALTIPFIREIMEKMEGA